MLSIHQAQLFNSFKYISTCIRDTSASTVVTLSHSRQVITGSTEALRRSRGENGTRRGWDGEYAG